MRRFLFLMILAAALALAAGCGGSPDVSGTAEDWTQRALDAMAEAKSYRTDVFVPSLGEGPNWTFEYVAPDSYRIQLAVVEKHGTGECYALPGGEASGDCDESDEVTDSYLLETLYVGDKLYARQCDDIDTGCGQWGVIERPPYFFAGPSPTYMPGWPLVAIETAQFEDVANDGNDVVLRGTVNHLRAIFENQRRLLTGAGITSFGSECTSSATMEGFEDPGAPVDQECHELTYDESLAQQEPDLSFFDETPAQIEVTIARDTSLVRRIVIHAAAPTDHEEGVELVIEYSLHNAVQIEEPQP